MLTTLRELHLLYRLVHIGALMDACLETSVFRLFELFLCKLK